MFCTLCIKAHRSKKHGFPWGEGAGAAFALDGVFWSISSSGGGCLSGDVCLAGSFGHTGAHEHRSILQQECGPFPVSDPSLLISLPCRLQIHMSPGVPQPHPAGLSLAGPMPRPALSREHPAATLQPGTPGRGCPGGDTDCIFFRDLISCS